MSSALFIGAQIARKPTDEFASLAWGKIKRALVNAFGRDPLPADVTEPTLERAINEVPELRADLESVFGRVSGLRRAQLVRKLLVGAKVLWVDDHPENNSWERQLFQGLGVQFVTVESTRSALACLKREQFDLMLSDIARADNPNEGVAALPAVRSLAPSLPVVFYIGHLSSSSPPEGAQGITDEPNELLHLMLDQLERHRL